MGQALVRDGLITPEQLERALQEQTVAGGRVGEVLVRNLVLTEDQIARAIARREGIRHLDLTDTDIDSAAVGLIPVRTALRKVMIPIGFHNSKLVLAMGDPLDVQAIDEAELWSHFKVEPVAVAASQVRYAIQKWAVEPDAIHELSDSAEDAAASEDADSEQANEGVPVVRIVNQLLHGAVRDRASDVHFEPEEHAVRVRSRIDGVLVESAELPKSSQAGLTSRIKVMADIDIIERRRPQDGRISVVVDDRSVDMRVATLPTPLGESIVVRVLDSTQRTLSLDEIGLSARQSEQLRRMLRKPYGAVFVAGPTGSGKTTTLYAALNLLNSSTRKIITIEDPIEYRMPGITQVGVNSRIGLTFASGLREVLRSDPDIVMVGEVRDAETASIAVRAALTGHVVLSSIHTNDAPSALTRLDDMGVEPYISSSALIGAIAQRLVRVLCAKCKRQVSVPKDVLVAAGFAEDEADHVQVYGPVGCSQCRNTGYHGRIGVFEIMEMNAPLRTLLLARAPAEEVRHMAIRTGMRTLRRDALDKVAAGITSIEELARVVI
jgi:type IV pilus assembly protein PilB